MRFELTKRDAIILGIFIPFLVACCYAYVRHATSSGAPAQAGREATGDASKSAVQSDFNDANVGGARDADIESFIKRRLEKTQRYSVIWQRSVFKPATLGRSVSSRHTTANKAVSTLLPPLPPPIGTQAQPQKSSGSAREPSEYRPPEKPRDIAYTAFVLVNGKPMALVEKTSTKEGFYVQEGDYVFGMRVVRIASDAIELEHDGRSIYYALGENKEKRELMARTVSSQKVSQTGTSTPQQQPAAQQAAKVEQTGQVQQIQQAELQPVSPPPPPAGLDERSRFFERMMRRLRERYGDNIPPDVMERINRFRRRSEEGS
ncbi:MAG: hypothetical protein N2381_02285 [Armatimonadetes bacterium]|nr:hypothetical protein [Armatimonadota bacterium]